MVTCIRCGKKNEDDARFCVNCGASIYAVQRDERYEEKHGDTCFGHPERRIESECFGLPYGGAIAGLVIGAIIILIGLGSLLGWRLDIGAIIMVVVGILIIAGAIYGQSRKKL